MESGGSLMVDRAVWGRMRWGRFRWGHIILNTLEPAVADKGRAGCSRADVIKINYSEMVKKVRALVAW